MGLFFVVVGLLRLVGSVLLVCCFLLELAGTDRWAVCAVFGCCKKVGPARFVSFKAGKVGVGLA